ncbi:MAG: hypothetical protein AB7V27_07090 [Candidatus Binatia bacterium]
MYGGKASFDIPLVPSEAKVDRYSLFSWHFELLRQAMDGRASRECVGDTAASVSSATERWTRASQ